MPAASCPLAFCYALRAMPYENMNGRKEKIVTILLILLGVIIIPVLFIWSADSLFALTLKAFIAAFFLLLLIRAVPRKENETTDQKIKGEDQDS